jgi:hypothetical protein
MSGVVSVQKRATLVISGWIRLHIITAGMRRVFRFGRWTVESMLSGTSEVADLMLTLASKGIFANMSSHLAADGAL